MDDFGSVLDDGTAQPGSRQAEAKGRVSGKGDGWNSFHWKGELAIIAQVCARGFGCNDQGVMAAAGKVLCHAHYAVCDAVDIWRERLRNDGDPHAPKIGHLVFE